MCLFHKVSSSVYVCEVNIQHVSVRGTESMALAQKMNREKTTAFDITVCGQHSLNMFTRRG